MLLLFTMPLSSNTDNPFLFNTGLALASRFKGTLTKPIPESRLFAAFSGYLYTKAPRSNKTWSWNFGYDISKENKRLWVCKVCVKKNAAQPVNFSARGTQNHIKHLYEKHSIMAPDGATKSTSQKKAESRASSRASSESPSIYSYWGLNPENPREQAAAYSFIKNFDKQEFRRLLIDWIVGFQHHPSSVRTRTKALATSTMMEKIKHFQQNQYLLAL